MMFESFKYQSMTLVALVFLLTISGCRRTQSTPSSSNSANQSNIPADGSSRSETATDKGDLKLRYRPPRNTKSLIANLSVTSKEALEKLITELNQRVKLPFDLYVSFEDCEDPDAFYDPELHQVTMCYQLLDDYYDLFATQTKDTEKLHALVKAAAASTFFHELGHALVHLWNIPVTGREEDAVDQLATLVLLERTENGEQMALEGAMSFKLYADLSKNEPKVYWDEHSLDEQRFYDTICLVYGHNDKGHQNLVKSGTLPAERAMNCAGEYEKLRDAWRQLLAPYLKDKDAPPSKLKLR